jgi:8-oxo-dGTP pyrophosphatase MutT (NUDIX family)
MPENSTEAVPPRHAASLIVLRDLPSGPAALMGWRGAGLRFMPNHLVFPGGAVDPEDSTAAAATELRPAVLRHLLAAAARELEEETGLTLGQPPQLDGFDYLCRAVTPRASPVRFDARFLVVPAERVGGTLAGSGELEGLRWVGLEEALALQPAWVTRNVIGRLQEWLAMSPQARQAREQTPLLSEKTWRLEGPACRG